MKTPANTYEDAEGWWYKTTRTHRLRCYVIECRTCGEPFVRLHGRKHVYCSLACYRMSCARCGAAFAPRSMRARYCSVACRVGDRSCAGCGRTYHPAVGTRGRSRQTFCSTQCYYDLKAPVGTTHTDEDGYVIVKVPRDTPGRGLAGNRSNWMLEHRYVMQLKLGRPLAKGENVHHMNGVRDDNRPENLELWKRKQPYGVRSADYHCQGCRCSEVSTA